MNYKIIYSDRKSIGIKIKDGKIIVMAPKRATLKLIDDTVKKHNAWIEKAIIREKASRERFEYIDSDTEKELKWLAKIYFDEKLRYYSNIMGLTYNKMTVTSAKTRYGSCSSKKNICFSYRLMLFPESVREYVVVHELAHLLEMNHSKKFYSIIEKYMPDYKERRKLLKSR